MITYRLQNAILLYLLSYTEIITEVGTLKDTVAKHVAENHKLQQGLNKYKAEQKKEENTENGFSNVEKEVLKTFLNKDSKLNKNELKTLVSEHLIISKATVELAIKNLINMELITLRENMLELTNEGLKLVDEMFTN